MHRLIVTSDTYKLASEADPRLAAANTKADPTERLPLALPAPAAGRRADLGFDLRGRRQPGPFRRRAVVRRRRAARPGGAAVTPPRPAPATQANRRAAYMIRGFSTSRDVMPNFLQAFDVDDGRVPCPLRTQTVTAPQGLFMMNSDEVERATAEFAERLQKESGGDLKAAVDLGYRMALARRPSPTESERALAYLDNDPARLKGLAWLLFNLDEFIYVQVTR